MVKNIKWLVASVILMFGCAPQNDGGVSDKQVLQQDTTLRQSIVDEELYPFMLGGIYFFNGYGGAARTFGTLIRPNVSAKPGTPEFTKELQAAYHRYFIFPFKPEDDPEGKEARKTFVEWWGVHNKVELENLMNWLLNEGHQAEFQKYKAIIEAHGGADADLSQLDFNTYGLDGTNRDTKATMSFVQAQFNSFSVAGIRAWDLARFVNNVCIAYQAQYFTKAEAITWLQRAVPIAREHYSSWMAYYNDFVLGRQFWSGGVDKQPIITETVSEMMRGEYSIFNYLVFR
jgi:hypothetical protein